MDPIVTRIEETQKDSQMYSSLVRVCDHTFHIGIAGETSTVVDLGMNNGEFSQWIISNTNAKCYGAEPVPELFDSLLQNQRIVARQVAIGGEAGRKKLTIPDQRCASLNETGVVQGSKQIDVDVVTLKQFINANNIRVIDLLKVDIEGAEMDMIANMDEELFGNIAQMTIEFHDFMKASYTRRVRELIARIRAEGFFYHKFWTLKLYRCVVS